MAEVAVKNIRKQFKGGKRPVLDDISFTVKDGEFVCLLGPSGCGKTTLLRIIAGLELADSGAISIGGADVTDTPPKDRDIAFVFQNYALYPHLLVRENIAMGLKLRGAEPALIEERIQEAARMLSLEELLERKPAALSGGQRQRVALGRALVRHPKATLLDEPLSNLDAVLRERTRGELKLLFKRLKGTAVYVTHDQIEAMTLSDRVVVLDKGRIQQVGTPADIYHHPANTFVATFLGAPPMNVFPLEEAHKARAVEDGAASGTVLGGLRPEDVQLSLELKDGFLVGKVLLAEPTGAQTVLSIESSGFKFRACWPGTFPGSREEVFFRLPAEKLHRFDADTGERL
ncbi:MAG: ABC transporter ATP-binding protein [Elusimicrobia bacterium]|nr:ABC transporter ATP-binding protein [Elusimicrobiota bacterium]